MNDKRLKHAGRNQTGRMQAVAAWWQGSGQASKARSTSRRSKGCGIERFEPRTVLNASPIAVNDAYTLSEDPTLGVFLVNAANGVLKNDSDPDGNALTASLVTNASHGTVTLQPDGTLFYRPTANFFGSDSFTYAASDGQASTQAVATFEVTNSYDPATAVADSYLTQPGATLQIEAAAGVLINDLNPDRANLNVQLVNNASQGQLNLAADGSFQLVAPAQAGQVTFSYRISDGVNVTSPATVTIQVNTPPAVNTDSYVISEDTMLSRNVAQGVLANDTDVDGNNLQVELIEGPQHGELNLAVDGSFTYAPHSNYAGSDQFRYRTMDGFYSSLPVTVELTVEAVNDLPVGKRDVYVTKRDAALEVSAERGMLANDQDVEQTALTAVLVQPPAQGQFTWQADGSFRYVPAAGFEGVVSFQYRASDGQQQSDPVTVDIMVGAPPVRINEIMAANATGLKTRVRASAEAAFAGTQLTPDWIELHNVTAADFDLSGYALTDDADVPMKWQFPAGTIVPASGYLLVYADQLPVADPALDESGRLHANFKLGVDGEYLALVGPSGEPVDGWEQGFPTQRADLSYGVATDLQAGYLHAVTPGAANSDRYPGVVADTKFDHDRGYYDQPIQVAISTETAGAVIRYTTDGTNPTATTGILYSGPIGVQTTTIVKAAAFKDGLLASAVDSQSYLYGSDILQQTGAGLNAVAWGHKGADWAMDPTIVNHADPELRPELADFERIPTVSMSMNFAEMFGAQGIYIRGEDVEKQISFEYFDPNRPGNGVQTISTVQIVGGSSPERWKSDKLSMRVRFTEDVGESELVYPVFGADAAKAFDTLVLDARLNNVWHYGGGSEADAQRARAEYLRDEYAADLQRAVGGVSTHSQHVHLYINGIYWGMHALHERPDENFAETYLGGQAEDYDVVKHVFSDVVSGTNAKYREMFTVVGSTGNLTDEKYQAISDLLDVDDFINYMLVNFYGGNGDWDHHNWYASRNRVDGKWRFHSWDAEKILQNVNDNVTNVVNQNSPTFLHRRLMTHPEYKLRFGDLVQKQFYHDGPMTPEAAADLYRDRADMINLAIRLESARWGDNMIDTGTKTRYTRQNWLNNVNGLLDNYFPRRTNIVLNQFVQRGWFAKDQAPVFKINGLDQHGGAVSVGAGLTMQAPEGSIYYTTDGTDPRLPGGQLAPGAKLYSDSLVLAGSISVQARMQKADGTWGPMSEATFSTSVAATSANLRVSEVQYHPANPSAAERAAGFLSDSDFEYIELVNIGNAPVNLRDVRFEQSVNGQDVEGLKFLFGDSRVQELAPGARVVVVENPEAFKARYGTSHLVAGPWEGGLSNSGERIVLMAGSQTLVDFTYSDQWVKATDGDGPSLQINQEAGDLALWAISTGWRASQSLLGSPGMADGSALAGDANGDGRFDSQDLVLVFQAGKYEDDVPKNATFAEGDWNGDGDFTSSDLVAAFQTGAYESGADQALAVWDDEDGAI